MSSMKQPPPGAVKPAYIVAAKRARLQYVTDTVPGIQRIARATTFVYRDRQGRVIRNVRVLERIRKLAVPPAWTQVWICPSDEGHIQATGRDQRGRKQYRYHERWRAIRDGHKFYRLLSFAQVLPRIRRRVKRDLKLPGMPRAKILATVVQLLDSTLIRVGNEEYAKQNGSFGLTTLRNSHAKVKKDEIRFEFRGKSGIQHKVSIRDRRLARIVRRCQEIPGQELFQYLDDNGKRHAIGSADVNEYLREAAAGDYTAKDFRTWHGTLLALRAFRTCVRCAGSKPSKRALNQCVKAVAQQLGNTAAVCRKCYIHPGLIAAFLDGSLSHAELANGKTRGLRADEVALLSWLHTSV